jgi:hypothetical protein
MKVEKNQNPSIEECFSLANFGNLATEKKAGEFKKGFFWRK